MRTPADVSHRREKAMFLRRATEALRPRRRMSVRVNANHGLGKRLRRFLRKVVSDPAFDEAVRLVARELVRVRGGLEMRRTVGIAL